MTIKLIYKNIEEKKERSAWANGVKAYALELLERLQEAADGGYFFEEDLYSHDALKSALLNGAADWKQYSWGGCSLIYDSQIAKRLCTASELRKTKNGNKDPNKAEKWLDVQARALFQAYRMITASIRNAA